MKDRAGLGRSVPITERRKNGKVCLPCLPLSLFHIVKHVTVINEKSLYVVVGHVTLSALQQGSGVHQLYRAASSVKSHPFYRSQGTV